MEGPRLTVYATGHYGAALLVYAPVAFLLLQVAPVLALVGGVGVLAISTLPDVDHRLAFVQHRTVTHTVPFLLAVSAALAGVGWWLAGTGTGLPGGRGAAAAFGFGVGLLGVGSHLLVDAITPMGIPLLWPLSGERFTLDVTPSNDRLANGVLLVLGVAAIGAVYALASP